MSKHALTPIKVLSFLLFISILFSCSKDSDLFAENILLDEIVNIEDSENNLGSQEIIETTIDLENAVISTNEDVAVLFNMLNNTSGKSKRNFKSFKQPKNGSLSLQKDSLALYSPSSDFNGTDELEITLEVTDEDDTITDLVVLIDANVIAVADVRNDTVTTTENTAVIIEPLNNDTFIGDNVIISEVTTPSHGSVVLNDNYVINYVPETNYIGEDTFFYTTEFTNTDGSKSMEQGTIIVTVNPINDTSGSSANLLFKSGFEGSLNISALSGGYQYITGTDDETGYLWPPTFWDSGQGASGTNGIHVINASASEVTNQFVTIDDENGSPTTALRQDVNVNNSSPTTQTPFQINNVWGNNEVLPWEYYYKFKIRLDDISNKISSPGDWRMIWQYKSDNWDDGGWPNAADKDGYRISLFIVNNSGNIQFRTDGDWQYLSNTKYWSQTGTGVSVPEQEWFNVEIYQKVSDQSDGRFWIKINGQIIAEHDGNNLVDLDTQGEYNANTKNSDTMWYWTMWQFYGNKTGTQWIDDMEVWDGIPY